MLGETEEAKIGVGVNEFGRESKVLVEAMEDDVSCVDLLKMLWVLAEV